MECGMASILIVDDSPEVRVALTTTLEDAGHTVSEPSDGRDIVEQAALIQPDAIVQDINMPDVDGITALRGLRSDPLTRDLPVIMLTAIADMDHVQTAIAAGAQDYVLKPWDADTVLERLFNAKESRRYKAKAGDNRPWPARQ
jgi:CheY-like chemotaxis protein